MLKSIRLQNFKCFEDSNRIDLEPINVFCGTNSSGKTTIIQSLLLLKQSFEYQTPYQNIILNGRWVHLGAFRDIIYKHKEDDEFKIDLEIQVYPREVGKLERYRDRTIMPTPYWRLDREINFGTDRKTWRKLGAQCFLNISYGIKGYPYKEARSTTINSLELKAKSIINGEEKEGMYIKLDNVKKDEYAIHWKNFKIPKFYLLNEVTNNIIKHQKEKIFDCTVCGGKHRFSSDIGKRHFRTALFAEHETKLNIIFDNMSPHVRSSSEKQYLSEYNLFLRPVMTVNNYLQYLFKSFHYLGPLRNEPARRYIYEEEPQEIGKKGENAPFLLSLEQNRVIPLFYFYDNFSNMWIKKESMALKDALRIWMQYLNISDDYEIESPTEITYFYLKPDSNESQFFSLADVGFGMSQIIPILIEGLRAPQGHTLVFEQPEIHLHPKLQMLLSDFFISMALSGKNLIIETHSEHLINRFVRRFVEDEKNDLASKINILFFEKRGFDTNIEHIEIDDKRGILNWPKDFFYDHSTEEKERIILAGIKKLKKTRRD